MKRKLIYTISILVIFIVLVYSAISIYNFSILNNFAKNVRVIEIWDWEMSGIIKTIQDKNDIRELLTSIQFLIHSPVSPCGFSHHIKIFDISNNEYIISINTECSNYLTFNKIPANFKPIGGTKWLHVTTRLEHIIEN